MASPDPPEPASCRSTHTPWLVGVRIGPLRGADADSPGRPAADSGPEENWTCTHTLDGADPLVAGIRWKSSGSPEEPASSQASWGELAAIASGCSVVLAGVHVPAVYCVQIGSRVQALPS